jgi:type III secretory pathway component EscT
MMTSLHSLCAPKSSAITIFIHKILSSIYIQKGTIYNINKVNNHLFYTTTLLPVLARVMYDIICDFISYNRKLQINNFRK